MSNKETMIKKLGSEEAYRAYLRKLGAKGGKNSKPPVDHPTRFDNNRDLASKAGVISGKVRKGVDIE